MTNAELMTFAEKKLHFNHKLNGLYPLNNVSLAQYLVDWLAHNYLDKGEGPLKNAHLTLPFSERAIRTYIRKLELDGLVVTRVNNSDKRYKNLQLTEEFIDLFKIYYELHKSL